MMKIEMIALCLGMVTLSHAECLSGDCQNGMGKRKDKDGVFEGNFKDGKLTGQGTWTGVDKSYSGEWKMNMADGYGTFRWGKGKLGKGAGECTGQWKEDKKHGRANCVWPSGAEYEGGFNMDKREGQGVLDWVHQHYDGEWHNDQKMGKCKLFRWASGATYEGDWKVNGPDGTGTYRWPDGSFYTGSWKGSKMHGRGAFHAADGEVKHQIFENGQGKEIHVKPGGKSWGELASEVSHPLFFALMVMGALAAAAYFFCRRKRSNLSEKGRYAELASPIGAEFQKLHVQVGAEAQV